MRTALAVVSMKRCTAYGPDSEYREELDRRSLNDGLWRVGSGTGSYMQSRKVWYGGTRICWAYLDEVEEINGGFACNMCGECGYSHPKIRLTGDEAQTTAVFEGLDGCRVPQWVLQLRLSGFYGDAISVAQASVGISEAVRRLRSNGVPNVHLRVRGEHPEARRMRREIEGSCARKAQQEQDDEVCPACYGLVGLDGQQNYLDAINASACECSRPAKRQRRSEPAAEEQEQEQEEEEQENEDEDTDNTEGMDSEEEAERREQAQHCECMICGEPHPDPEQLVRDNPEGVCDLPSEPDSHGWRVTADDWSRGMCPACREEEGGAWGDEDDEAGEDEDDEDDEDEDEAAALFGGQGPRQVCCVRAPPAQGGLEGRVTPLALGETSKEGRPRIRTRRAVGPRDVLLAIT